MQVSASVPTKAGIAAPLSGLASSSQLFPRTGSTCRGGLHSPRNCDFIFNINILSKSRGAPAARRGDPVQVLALVRLRPGIASPACAGSQVRDFFHILLKNK